MIPIKIKKAIENSNLRDVIDQKRYGENWNSYTRTVFDKIAKKINAEITAKVIQRRFLVDDLLLLGQEELENILFKNRLRNTTEFIKYLKGLNGHNTHHWISGKTLQGYWNGGNAKDKKLNVLLTFMDVDINYWDEWKLPADSIESDTSAVTGTVSHNILLKSHYLGFYYRYYQKTDGNAVLIKTPLVIYCDGRDRVKVKTKTLGHAYRSSSISLRSGALYIDCENVNWDEKESHVYNVGLETDPELLSGVSITLNKRGRALGIKNLLMKQNVPFDYENTPVLEIPFEQVADLADTRILNFFKQGNDNLINTPFMHSFEDL